MCQIKGNRQGLFCCRTAFIVLFFMHVDSVNGQTTNADVDSGDDQFPTDNIIVIEGRRASREKRRSTGRSDVFTPVDESQKNTYENLKKDSSVILPDSGKISPSGFVVPRIRGHDMKMTDVFIEDTLLQDPYTGFPIAEDLDLRAFGTLELHQGVAPASIHSLNPVGSIRYQFLENKLRETILGTQYGRPYGFANWGLAQMQIPNSDDHNISLNIYGRTHHSNGKYSYYSDEGTPYNSVDDQMRDRDHNDQRSFQWLPRLSYSSKSWRISSFLWQSNSEKSIPSSSALLLSDARENNKSQIANLTIQRLFRIGTEAKSLNLNLGIDIGQKSSDMFLSDPTNYLLQQAKKSRFSSDSHHARVFFDTNGRIFNFYSSADFANATLSSSVESRDAFDVSREMTHVYLGSEIKVGSQMILELKTSAIQSLDKWNVHGNQELIADIASVDKARMNKNLGFNMSYDFFHLSPYIQWAQSQRAPSVLEQFGNGGSIRSNFELQNEVVDHRELGVVFRELDYVSELRFSSFFDKTKNKISFTPVFSDAMKAQNLRQTYINGLDVLVVKKWLSAQLSWGNSFFDAKDMSNDQVRRLPLVPRQISVLNFQYQSSNVTTRLQSKYRSEIFRDLGNSIELPGSRIEDLNVDYN
ncbi:MAG: TonB-dependent receptor, partial [Proteobacteria bacterium]|nr:TonB-dependent receptor [Pseudomonadota bacterium]